MVGKVGELKWGITESEQSQTRGGGEVMRKLQEKWSIRNKWLSGRQIRKVEEKYMKEVETFLIDWNKMCFKIIGCYLGDKHT